MPTVENSPNTLAVLPFDDLNAHTRRPAEHLSTFTSFLLLSVDSFILVLPFLVLDRLRGRCKSSKMDDREPRKGLLIDGLDAVIDLQTVARLGPVDRPAHELGHHCDHVVDGPDKLPGRVSFTVRKRT